MKNDLISNQKITLKRSLWIAQNQANATQMPVHIFVYKKGVKGGFSGHHVAFIGGKKEDYSFYTEMNFVRTVQPNGKPVINDIRLGVIG